MKNSRHSTHNSPKHNTTRSGSTKDKRPKEAEKQATAAMDPTGAGNPVSALSSRQDRGQNLGSGPWGQELGHPPGTNIEPWSGA